MYGSHVNRVGGVETTNGSSTTENSIIYKRPLGPGLITMHPIERPQEVSWVKKILYRGIEKLLELVFIYFIEIK